MAALFHAADRNVQVQVLVDGFGGVLHLGDSGHFRELAEHPNVEIRFYYKILMREAVYLWYYFSILLEQIFPYWVLGMMVGSAVSVFLKDKIHNTFRALGKKKLDTLGIVMASILGIASPHLYVWNNSYFCFLF